MLSISSLVLWLSLSTALNFCTARLTEAGLARKNLVPSRRTVTLESRDLWRRAIVPQDRVQLNYGTCEYAP